MSTTVELQKAIDRAVRAEAGLSYVLGRAELAEIQRDALQAKLDRVRKLCALADHGQALKSGIPGAVGAVSTSDMKPILDGAS